MLKIARLVKLGCWKATVAALVCLLGAFSPINTVVAAQKPQATLGREIRLGFAGLRARRCKTALAHFESAMGQFEESSGPPKFNYARQNRAEMRRDLELYGSDMGGRQALATFACFSAALAGEDRKATEYFDKVKSMRTVMWGKSWDEYTVLIQRRFFAVGARGKPERYGRLLRYAGELLLDAGESRGIQLVKRARRKAPKDAESAAILAGYYITHHNAGRAKREAVASLRIKPDQPRVLIDLATSEWMLGHLTSAYSAAQRAASLDPDLPGPHATLAFVALQRGDCQTAIHEAEEGQRLSSGHAFYATLLAACVASAGDQQRATKLMKEAWQDGSPGNKQLKDWFFRRKPLYYARMSSR